jgi:hypothetical protein
VLVSSEPDLGESATTRHPDILPLTSRYKQFSLNAVTDIRSKKNGPLFLMYLSGPGRKEVMSIKADVMSPN